MPYIPEAEEMPHDPRAFLRVVDNISRLQEAAARIGMVKHELSSMQTLVSKVDDLGAMIYGFFLIRWLSFFVHKVHVQLSADVVKRPRFITVEANLSTSFVINLLSVQAHITPTIAYYTSAKHMWEFLKQTYSHDKNMSKVLQVEEELLKLQQGDSDLAQYFASVKSAYERLKALRPPCQSCYKTHFEQHMVAKFLAGSSSDFAVAKAQMLTGAEITDLAEAYNRLSRLAVTLSPSSTDASSSALAAPGVRGQSLAISGSRGQTFNRGRGGRSSEGGRGRFQCTFCGRLGHLEDRCWNKHGRPMIRGSESSQIKNSSHIPKASHVEDDHTESNAENVTVSMSKSEYEQFLAQKASSSSLASTVVGDYALSTTMQNRDPGLADWEDDWWRP
ncbi:hypothetical protein EJ110_NYTH47576 [Nymphaea thermarum]|nr:hypothetical protein EJ110_NYTH47576 [Nymphaea thermarum]